MANSQNGINENKDNLNEDKKLIKILGPILYVYFLYTSLRSVYGSMQSIIRDLDDPTVTGLKFYAPYISFVCFALLLAGWIYLGIHLLKKRNK